MIKKRGRTKLPESGTLFAPSNTLLDNHFSELLEAIEEIGGLTTLLKALPSSSDKRDEHEGRLYAALTISITTLNRRSRNGIAWWTGWQTKVFLLYIFSLSA